MEMEGGREMSEQNDETADGCEMLTATSDPVVLYQALCRATDEIEQLKRERDEAREKYDTLAVENMLEVNKLCKERDEAREQVDRYRDKLDLLPISWEL
jgi:hypothetical protein